MSMCAPIEHNPWRNITWKNTIADCDRYAFNQLTQKQKDLIQSQLLPEPYWGNPDGDIVILCGNPGYSVSDNCFANNKQFLTLFTNVYSHQETRHIWICDGLIPEVNCPVSSRRIIHEGIKWWKSKIGWILKQREVSLFVAEFFPYHSKESAPFMKNHKQWNSSKYVDRIIEGAIHKHKIIIILRWEKAWQNRIPHLKEYDKLIVVKNARAASISEGNLQDRDLELLKSFLNCT